MSPSKNKPYIHPLGEALRDLAVVSLDLVTCGLATDLARNMYNPDNKPIPTTTATDLPFSPPRLQVIWFNDPKYNKWTY